MDNPLNKYCRIKAFFIVLYEDCSQEMTTMWDTTPDKLAVRLKEFLDRYKNNKCIVIIDDNILSIQERFVNVY